MNGTSNYSSAASPLATVAIFQLVCYSIIMLIGAVGNSLICLTVLGQSKRKPCEYFILNLAITDLAASIISVPLDIAEKLAGYFPFGTFLCKIVYPLQTIIMTVSVATLLAMSLERHRAIIHPLKPRVQTQMTVFVIVLFWIVSVLLISPYITILKHDGAKCNENWPGDQYIKAYTLLLFVLLYILPLSVITVTYVQVGRKLCEENKRLENIFTDSGRCNVGRLILKKRAQRNNRIVKIFVTAVVAFAVCMLPNHIIWLWHDYGGSESSIIYQLFPFGPILVYANSCINPFIFGTLHPHCCTLKGLPHGGNHQAIQRGRFSIFSLRFSLSSSSVHQRSISSTSSYQRRRGSRRSQCRHFASRELQSGLQQEKRKTSNRSAQLRMESHV